MNKSNALKILLSSKSSKLSPPFLPLPLKAFSWQGGFVGFSALCEHQISTTEDSGRAREGSETRSTQPGVQLSAAEAGEGPVASLSLLVAATKEI